MPKTVSVDELPNLKKAYKKAIKDKVDTIDYKFMDGEEHKMYVPFLKYLIEYTEQLVASNK